MDLETMLEKLLEGGEAAQEVEDYLFDGWPAANYEA